MLLGNCLYSLRSEGKTKRRIHGTFFQGHFELFGIF